MTLDPSRAVELRLRAAVESSPSGLLMSDAEGKIVLVNREIERLFDYSREELLGKPVELLIPERFRNRHPQYRAGFVADPRVRAMGAGRDLYGRRRDGTEVPVEIGLTPVATDEGLFVLSSIVDISARKRAEEEQRRLEEQLRQAQKLEAVGTLAGGIAHDFNNILGVIIGYGEFLGRAMKDERAQADLHELLTAAERGRELVQRILAFSRRQEVVRRPLALGEVVADAAKLLRPTLPPSVEFRLRVHQETPRILANATSVHQVLMNLATNAAHAMPDGGTLEVSAEPFYVRDSVARARPDLHEGPYALLIVRDSGCGMDQALRARAFEPFFTTKPPGGGSGLGLAIVHGIMREHEGTVELASEPGQGTTVSCLFPALGGQEETKPNSGRGIPMGHGERVLLVEDEPSLAAVGERNLRDLGYQPTVQTDSGRALELFRARPFDFELVITDYSMPRMSGLDLARGIVGIRPDIPVLMVTGFMEDLSAEVMREAGVRQLLRKPLTNRGLGEAVSRLLGA